MFERVASNLTLEQEIENDDNPYVNSVNFIYDCDEIIGYNKKLEKAKAHDDVEKMKVLNDKIHKFHKEVYKGEKKVFNGQCIICFEQEESNFSSKSLSFFSIFLIH